MWWCFQLVLLLMLPLVAWFWWRRAPAPPPLPRLGDDATPSPFLPGERRPLLGAALVPADLARAAAPALPPAPVARAAGAAPKAVGRARWIPPGEAVAVGPFTIVDGMVYVGWDIPRALTGLRDEPALIDPRLPIDHAHPDRAGATLSYWPAYAALAPSARAAYLEWLAGGRRDPATNIGYVFLFFYGLERRALVDRTDVTAVRTEVQRLLGIYGQNRSFRGYAKQLLAFTAVAALEQLDDAAIANDIAPLAADEPIALGALLAWHALRKRPLPSERALLIAETQEDAKRSVVVRRSPEKFNELFALRYREAFGDGLVVEAAARAIAVPYRPASAGLVDPRSPLVARMPDALGRRAQFAPLVRLWNSCVDDLKRFSSERRKAGEADALTAAQWEALPPELREQYEHPDRDAWDDALAATEECEGRRVLDAAALARLGHLPARERYTAAQLRKVVGTAAALGYAVEPDPRVSSSSVAASAHLILWRSDHVEAPQPKVYGPASIVLRLALSVAGADGSVDEEERSMITGLLEYLFPLDEATRERLEALRDLLVRHPARATGLTRKLAEKRSAEQLAAVGRLLVAVAAADGTISRAEDKALRALYRNLGLPLTTLDAALAASGARLAEDEPVVAAVGRAPEPGSPVTPPAPRTGVRLDDNAIAQLIAESREVTELLAEVFVDDASEISGPIEDAPPAITAAATAAAGPDVSPPTGRAALAPALGAILDELLTRGRWNPAEVRALAARHGLMPAAILDGINEWSDEHLGDLLIADEDDWIVNQHLARGSA